MATFAPEAKKASAKGIPEASDHHHQVTCRIEGFRLTPVQQLCF